MGTIQIPAGGSPIVLMADRQTTGGYARVATVISADLGLVGQMKPGDWLTFAVCSHEAALTALGQRMRDIDA
jgi:antagonist of KipI